MVGEDLARQERERLRIVYDHVNERGEFPDNTWLAEELGVSVQGVCNFKRRLRQKGYLQGKYGTEGLTEKAIQFLSQDIELPGYRAVVSAYIPLVGEVSAGRGSQFDELAVYINESDESTLESIAVPQTEAQGNVVAMRVRGNSMEDTGIFDGDYVIVELGDNVRLINENQIIVARYLPQYEEDMLDEDMIDSSSIELVGPTLKVYKGQYIDSDNKLCYRLGRVKDYGQKNPHEIKTRILEQIGHVIGVYRTI